MSTGPVDGEGLVLKREGLAFAPTNAGLVPARTVTDAAAGAEAAAAVPSCRGTAS